MKFLTTCFSLLFCLLTNSPAAVVVNPAQTITHLLRVNVIQVAEDDGSNAAPLFGNTTQQNSIFSKVDEIWAQAGIDVEFSFAPGTHNNSASLYGTNTLNQVISQGAADGFTVSGALDLFMVRANQGQTAPLGNLSSAGYALLPGDGQTLWVGPGLLAFENGRDVIAKVLAHEIGHNLGLPHPTVSTDGNGQTYDDNLMVGSGSDNPAGLSNNGELLLQSQIDSVLTSPFLVAVPEPSTTIFVLLGVGIVCMLRKRR